MVGIKFRHDVIVKDKQEKDEIMERLFPKSITLEQEKKIREVKSKFNSNPDIQDFKPVKNPFI
ncbi:hypothetical protein HB847_04165 [Listeria booriae]|uniref:Uncharacterized protein n=1 Tax=Listeria booriae TaxID=1552123 RepID=A0A841Y5K3_9LIST|nr:hypothetical protein [Listeria booriae]MBC1371555.1 hypothetical protein [Listeria booriae]